MTERYSATLLNASEFSGRCIIPVCCSSRELNGSRFKALVLEASRHFSTAHVILCDTLDVHNLIGKFPDPRGEAIRRADLWLKNHIEIINIAFENNWTLQRWDDVREDPSFGPRSNKIRELYQKFPRIKNAIDGVCSHYVGIAAQREVAKGGAPNYQDLMERSVAYMQEEIAGMAVYYQWHKAPEVYPGEAFADNTIFNVSSSPQDIVSMIIPPVIPVQFARAMTSIPFPQARIA